MRHRINKVTLGRDKDHRKSLLRNLASQIISSEKVKTTIVKAKFVRPYIEKIITKAVKAYKSSDKIFKFNVVKALRTKLVGNETVKKLLEDIAPRFTNTPGGYTKITKIGNRPGDNAMKARIELTAEKAVVAKAKKAKKDE